MMQFDFIIYDLLLLLDKLDLKDKMSKISSKNKYYCVGKERDYWHNPDISTTNKRVSLLKIHLLQCRRKSLK